MTEAEMLRRLGLAYEALEELREAAEQQSSLLSTAITNALSNESDRFRNNPALVGAATDTNRLLGAIVREVARVLAGDETEYTSPQGEPTPTPERPRRLLDL